MSEYGLITVEEAKNFPGLNSLSDSQDPILDALIDATTVTFEAYWDTYGVRREVTERHNYSDIKHDSRNADIIYLRKPPVVSSGITIEDPAGNTIDSDDYWVDQDMGVLRTAGAWQIPQDDNGFQTYWEITYTGGHAVNTAAVPSNIKTAAKMHVASLYKRPDRDVIAKKIGDFSLTYRQEAQSDELPTIIKHMISPWKKVSV